MKLLVANRGEIAARIFRTAREQGVTSVAIYTQAEADASWVKLADEAYRLEGKTPAQTYLNAQQILHIALKAQATAIHPGYGFLSENVEFAALVKEKNLTWVGPAPEVINQLGDKARARQLALSQAVGVIPGTQTPLRDLDELLHFGAEVGYPIVTKDPAGGGGRGIIEYTDAQQARKYFNDRNLPVNGPLTDTPLGTSFLEKRMVNARHIETQCLRDMHGNFWLASTRDCSVQRRNQKLIEEAPAPFLTAETEQNLRDWSQKLFHAVNYVGAGTCEFLVTADGNAYFLEVNPRLQVEHTITEEVTGVDLVALQLAIARGESLRDHLRAEHNPRGHSIQLRITSEDPAQNLLPQAGRLTGVTWPAGAGIRIDAALTAGEEIPTAFDSLIAKLIITASTREAAIAKARRALDELQIQGVPTSAPLYQFILQHSDFQTGGGQVHTRWLEENVLADGKLSVFLGENAPSTEKSQIPHENANSHARNALSLANAIEIPVEISGKREVLRVPAELFQLAGHNDYPAASFSAGLNPAGIPGIVPAPTQVRRNRRTPSTASNGDSGAVTAPMQATITSVPVEVGQTVEAGDLVCVIEAMKMEQPLYAAVAGRVTDIKVQPADSVSSGQLLLVISEVQ